MQETQVRFLHQEDPLEKEMATHSNILSWEIPCTEKPEEPQSTGSERVHHHQNVHNIKFTILTIFKHLIQWHWVHLQSYVTPLTSTCRTFSSSQTETLAPIPLSPAPGHHQANFCSCESDDSGFLM